MERRTISEGLRNEEGGGGVEGEKTMWPKEKKCRGEVFPGDDKV